MVEPLELLERTIVFDTDYKSRTAVINSLRKYAVARTIIEAPSVVDCLRTIESGGIDICFLGPSLSITSSRHLMRIARNLPTSQSCAFVALDQDGISNYGTLKNEIKIDETLKFPFVGNDFITVICKMIKKFKPVMFRSYQLSVNHSLKTFDQIHRPLSVEQN